MGFSLLGSPSIFAGLASGGGWWHLTQIFIYSSTFIDKEDDTGAGSEYYMMDIDKLYAWNGICKKKPEVGKPGHISELWIFLFLFIHKQPNFIQAGYKSLQDSSSAQPPDINVHKESIVSEPHQEVLETWKLRARAMK